VIRFSEQTVRTIPRLKRVVLMRTGGASFRQIGDAVGCCESRARQLYLRGVKVMSQSPRQWGEAPSRGENQ
jgi:hypothetical protein